MCHNIKENLISSTTTLGYELPDDLRLKKWGNIGKISNLDGDKSILPSLLSRNWIFAIAAKKYTKLDTKVL